MTRRAYVYFILTFLLGAILGGAGAFFLTWYTGHWHMRFSRQHFVDRMRHELNLADDQVRQLNQMSVAVNCSAKEGWGLTVIEANACGVPVVASDVPGLRDSVVDEKTGLLYEYGNIEQLAQKIALILRDENLRNRMRMDALEWGRSFNWEESAKKMIGFLETVIERKSLRSVS